MSNKPPRISDIKDEITHSVLRGDIQIHHMDDEYVSVKVITQDGADQYGAAIHAYSVITLADNSRVELDLKRRNITGNNHRIYCEAILNGDLELEAAKWGRLDLVTNHSDELCIAAVQYGGGFMLEGLGCQTREICLAAVRADGLALRFVEKQTEEICLAAVKEDGFALEYVEHQTDEISLAAVKEDGCALQFVRNQTPEICKTAVQQHAASLQYVRNQTDEICITAVQQHAASLQFVEHQTDAICKTAVQQDGRALKYVRNQTPEILRAADDR